jgi:hypothetical protein
MGFLAKSMIWIMVVDILSKKEKEVIELFAYKLPPWKIKRAPALLKFPSSLLFIDKLFTCKLLPDNETIALPILVNLELRAVGKRKPGALIH